jgi:hypothetical protein
MGAAVTTTPQQQVAVAIDAQHWDVDEYRLWESTEPGVLLYARHELRLAADSVGRPVASVNRDLKRSETGTGFEPTGGKAVLGFLGAEPDDAAVLLSLQDTWTRAVRAGGYDGAGPGTDPRYRPLPVREPALSARFDPAQASVVAPGQEGTTLTVDLTAAGAAAWAAAIRDHGAVAGAVRLTYAYPQIMPPATAVVQVHGAQVYTRLAQALTPADDGEVSGTAAQIRAAWAELAGTGAIEVSLTGSPASSLARARDALVEQARQNLLDTMFVARSATTTGPPVHVLRWKRAADMPDLPLMVSVEGWTWLTETLEASVAQLLSGLDPGVVTDVLPSVTVPVTVYVESSETARTVSVSLDFGDLRAPEALTFDKAGGSRTITVTTDRPEQLRIRQHTQIDFARASWPVVTLVQTLGLGDLPVLVAPDRMVDRLQIFAFLLKEGEAVLDPFGEHDAVTVSARYENPELQADFTETSQMQVNVPMDLLYPLPLGEFHGRFSVQVLASVGGRVLRASRDLGPDERHTLILLIGKDGSVQFVTDTSPIPESGPAGRRPPAPGEHPLVRREVPPHSEGHRDPAVSLDVALVPQPTTVSCWAAALAMVAGFRDGVRLDPAGVAARTGMDLDTWYPWPQIRPALAAWGLAEERARSSPPQEWAALLREWGPIWVVDPTAPERAVVVGAVTGDGTQDGTWVRLYNPWPRDIGSIDRRTFREFNTDFGLGRSGVAMVHG